MATDSKILREYLISLGFKVDKSSSEGFDKAVTRGNLKAMALAQSVKRVADGVNEMVVQFARGLERMYYASRKADSTVGNLQAMEFGAKAVGLEAGQMQAALTNMARALRTNPGLKALVESFGVKVTGRDMSDVAVDVLGVLKRMPFYISSQYAGLFGIGPDELLLLTEGLDKLKEAAAARKQMAQDAGLDIDKATAAAREYSQQLRDIQEMFGILKDTAAIALLPAFKELAGVTKEVMRDWTSFVKNPAYLTDGNGILGFLRKVGEALGLVKPLGGGVELSQAVRESAQSWVDKGGRRAGGRVGSDAASADPEFRRNNPGNLRSWGDAPIDGGFASFATLQAGISAMAGNLVAYAKRGNDTLRKIISEWAPAKDNNQTDKYIANMASWLGVDPDTTLDMTDPGTLAAVMKGITRQEHGAIMPSSAFLGAAKERLQGVTIQQQTTINVQGGDAAATGRAVANEQRGVTADMVNTLRNQTGVVQ